MAEILMEHKPETAINKLLQHTTGGAAVALRGCTEEIAQAVAARFGEAVGKVRLFEPCKVEHPHSAFLRKNIERNKQPCCQTTLFAPGGKLVEERLPEGDVCERFIRKTADFEVLRGHLKDVELHPARALHPIENCTTIASVGLTPMREMETRWAGPELLGTALAAQDEAAASCLRKLERHLHRRCEEACAAGCTAAVLHDLAVEPLPQAYMPAALRHIEWMRHNGLAPFVEVSQPNEPLLSELKAARAGVRTEFANSALYGESFTLPEGLKILFDVNRDELGALPTEAAKSLVGKCGSAVLLLDCFQAEPEELFRLIELLLGICDR
jgi:hypothetical protein